MPVRDPNPYSRAIFTIGSDGFFFGFIPPSRCHSWYAKR